MTRKTQPPDFERSLTELEQLVERLERGDLPLDEALGTFERGVALTRECQTALRAAQQKVEILLQRSAEEAGDAASGQEQLEPFASDAPDAAGDGG